MTNPRIYLPRVNLNRKLLRNATSTFDFEKNALTQSHTLAIKLNYTVGATAPTLPCDGGLANLVEQIEVRDSRGTTYHKFSGVFAAKKFNVLNGTALVGVDLDLSTGADVREATLLLHIPYGQPNSSQSVYDSGMNTYTKEAYLDIRLSDFNEAGVLFGSVGTFAIDEDSVRVDIDTTAHSVDASHPARANAADYPMSTYIEKPVTIEQTSPDFEIELDKGKAYAEINIIEVARNSANNQTTATDGVLDAGRIQLKSGDLSGRELGSYTAKIQRFRTAGLMGRQTRPDGFVVLNMADDNRMKQSKTSTVSNPINIYLPVIAGTGNTSHRMRFVQCGMMGQE